MKKKIIIGVIILLFIILTAVGLITYFKSNKKTGPTDISYDIPEIEYRYFIVSINEKFGVIDTNGNIIIEAKYDNIVIPNPKKAVFICSNNEDNKNKIFNDKAKEIFTIYDNVEAIPINGIISSLPYEKDTLRYNVNGLYGLVDLDGKRNTKAIYEEITGLKYKEGELLAKHGGKYGVISTKGEKIIDFQYDNIEADKFYIENIGYTNSGYITCQTKEDGYRYGYNSKSGKKILDTEYNDIQRITEITEDNNVYLIASQNGQYGLLKNNEKIIDYRFQGIEYNEQNNLLILNRATRYGVYTLSGEEIIPLEYKTLLFNGIYIYAKNGDVVKYFTNSGEEVSTGFTSLHPVLDNKYYISTNQYGLYGIVDSKMNTKVDNKYVLIDYLFDNYFLSYKNETGREIIDVEDEIIKEFDQNTLLNRIGKTNLIKAEDMQNNNISIYDKNIHEIANLNNANIDIRDTYIKLYNDETNIYMDMNGKIIKEAEALTSSEEAPDKIGEYLKEYYGYSQVYYTRD